MSPTDASTVVMAAAINYRFLNVKLHKYCYKKLAWRWPHDSQDDMANQSIDLEVHMLIYTYTAGYNHLEPN